MKMVPSPVGRMVAEELRRKWLLAKLAGECKLAHALYVEMGKLVPKGFCFHGVKSGRLLFSGTEREREDWPANVSLAAYLGG